MAIIGYNSVGGSAFNRTSATKQRLIDKSTYTYTAGANQEVFKFWYYCGVVYNGDGNGVELAVYDITGGVNGATKIASGTIATLATSSWNSVTITPVAMTQGNLYAIAVRVISSTNIYEHYTYDSVAVSRSTLDGTSAFASTWTDNANDGGVMSAYAETQTASTGTSTIAWLRI